MQSLHPLVEMHGVSKVYQLDKKRSVTALKGIELCVDRGDFFVITGRSGCGKTTLLNLISGLTSPSSGKVLLDQTEVWKLPDLEQSLLRNKKIGFVFQFPSLMPSLTALENVILPTIVANKDHRGSPKERAANLLAEVGLADKIDAYPRQLSAGQQQRVVVARALVNEPELLLADEPTSNLDEQTELEIMGLIRHIHEQRGITILLVTHTTELVPYGTRAMRMSAGEIVA